MGGTGLDAHHADLPALVLVNNLLGGPAMNSRLNLHIRERHGIAYQIESFLNPYSDTGIWGIYAGTDEEAMDRCQRLILRELKQLREVRLGSLQFSKAKTQLLGQMALAQESNANLMTALGKSLLTFNRVDTFSEMVTKIDAVTPAQMQDVAQRVFDPSQISALRFVPKA
jgi:predicted Zn-dependent peptidase